MRQGLRSKEAKVETALFVCIRILFAICTSTFSELCKKTYTVACRRVLTSTPL
jgi:hypothetical protein